MTLDAALRYAAGGWPVFPCRWLGPNRKCPLTLHGFHDATRDESIIRAWWQRRPLALIGIPTGRAIGAVVLDIDVKRADANGFDSLNALGVAILPATPMVHTASGGLHVYLAPPHGVDIRNTAGKRGAGIGPGLDWRSDGGYVIAPAPGSGDEWDPDWNFDTVALAPTPKGLLPRVTEQVSATRPVKPATGLSPYAEAALDSACRRIIAAPPGQQEATLNAEAFAIGTLAGAWVIPSDFARRAVIWAAHRMPDHDPRRPWHARQIENKVNRAFDDGMRRPRKARCA
jgi:Bifunctional DNA primase/polymerase, N-terminal